MSAASRPAFADFSSVLWLRQGPEGGQCRLKKAEKQKMVDMAVAADAQDKEARRKARKYVLPLLLSVLPASLCVSSFYCCDLGRGCCFGRQQQQAGFRSSSSALDWLQAGWNESSSCTKLGLSTGHVMGSCDSGRWVRQPLREQG